MYQGSYRNNATVQRLSGLTFKLCLLTILTIPSSPAHAEQDAEPSIVKYTPDEQRLIEAGFPVIDEHWISNNFKEAKEAIHTVSQENPAGLPRWSEGEKGLFTRLLAELEHITTAMEDVMGETDTIEEYQKAQEYFGWFTTEFTLPIW